MNCLCREKNRASRGKCRAFIGRTSSNKSMNANPILCLALVLGGGLLCFRSGARNISETNGWIGFPILPSITNANPAVRNPISVHVPTQIRIERTSDMLSVTIDTNRLESTNLMVGTNMVIGFRGWEFVYPVGEPRPANDRERLAGGLAFGSATSFYHAKPDGIPQAGRNYVVEMELEVFETDIPPQHHWRPQGSKNYKVLWQRTLKQTVE